MELDRLPTSTTAITVRKMAPKSNLYRNSIKGAIRIPRKESSGADGLSALSTINSALIAPEVTAKASSFAVYTGESGASPNWSRAVGGKAST
jgi:hypothetical protein